MNELEKVVVYYLWNFKPGEKSAKPPMEYIVSNSRYFPDYRIYDEPAVIPYVSNFSKLSNIWASIPWWIVKTDIARLLVLYMEGGFYLDVDARVNKSLLPTLRAQQKNGKNGKNMFLFVEKIVGDTASLGRRENKSEKRKLRIANYAFGVLTKRHPFLLACIHESIKRLLIILNELHRSSTGSSITEEDLIWIAGPDVVTTVYHTTSFDDVYVFDQSYIKNMGFGSWRK